MTWSRIQSFSLFSEILLEERSNGRCTMDRENRRVAAMSWGGGDELPPPKPARVPITGRIGYEYLTRQNDFQSSLSFINRFQWTVPDGNGATADRQPDIHRSLESRCAGPSDARERGTEHEPVRVHHTSFGI